MPDTKNQTSGDGSVNIQGEDVNLNFGITYEDARQVSLDVFKSNFLELSRAAGEIAFARVQEMTEAYLKKLMEKDLVT